jgi:hypothetical protein
MPVRDIIWKFAGFILELLTDMYVDMAEFNVSRQGGVKRIEIFVLDRDTKTVDYIMKKEAEKTNVATAQV